MITNESEIGNGYEHLAVHLALPVHWRTVVWACGAWRAGGAAVLGAGPEVSRWQEEHPHASQAVLSVASQPEDLLPQAPVQALVPLPSLALRWPGPLPPLVLDGAADLMGCPDVFPATPNAPEQLALTAVGAQGQVQSWTRGQLVAAAAPHPEAQPGQPLLVHEQEPAPALLGCLRAWASGGRAVLVAPEADAALLAAVTRQEGCAAA